MAQYITQALIFPIPGKLNTRIAPVAEYLPDAP